MPAKGGSPPLGITMPDVFFTVDYASPNRHHYQEHYKEWTSQHGGVILIMNLWSIEELYVGTETYGSIIDRLIINPGAFETQTKATLASPLNAEKLKHLVAYAREIDAKALEMSESLMDAKAL
ncbi:hypothetical protein PTI98_008117 [Pleurotus ostreatus]|nr:hypothetical protein PTI98_008117 [Pleurotus ostreatus]